MSSCSSGLCGTLNKDVLTGLKKLSSAEDFFHALGVAYDPAVLNVARLHILKRMGAYLERAYEDFKASTPINERVFKVHKDAVAPPSNFVPFDSLLN
jgi:nitrogenase-stabilizing/protective protein